MNKTTAAILGAWLFTAALATQARAGTADFPEYGFAIDALDAKPSAAAPTTALMMFLPASDGFGPNVNVNIQPYPGSMKEYISLSKAQFQKMSWTVVDEKQVGDAEWKVEYKGPMKGNDLHFYARAVSKDGKVYLVTATAQDSQWNTVGSTLRSHVDSFKAK